eukprot:m.13875 g.13875  ORF g.13875 m.13875 type:complete len:99 (+) comp4211_c0_seq2:120-416(+)
MSQNDKNDIQKAEDPYVALFGEGHDASPKHKHDNFLMENPLVPAFISLAGISLVGGLWAYKTGRQQASQNFQRARVFFQGLAVGALVLSTWNYNVKKD